MRYKLSLTDTRQRRRIQYVDETIQKFMLVGLVLLEPVLAGASVWLLHWRFNQIVEQNLYRVHLAEASSLFGQLLHEAFFLSGIFTLANVIALLIADLIWRRYVNSVLRHFRASVDKTSKLDFSSDPATAGHHPVLALAETQRAQERARLAAIRKLMTNLGAEVLDQTDVHGMRDQLKTLDALLPRHAQ